MDLGEAAPRGDLAGHEVLPAEALAALEQRHAMAALGGDARRCQPCRATADDGDALGLRGGPHRPETDLRLPADGGIVEAADAAAAIEADDAGLVRVGADADALAVAAGGL